MRVLFITSIYPSEEKPAAGVFHQTQADSLKNLGIHVDVVCPVPNTPRILGMIHKRYKEYLNQPKRYEWEGINIYRPRFLAFPGQLKWAQPHKRFAAAIDQAIKENHLEFDVIHAHLAMPAGGAAAIIAKKYKKPYVLTLHGSDVNVYPNYSKGALEAFRFAVNNAQEVIAVSEALADKTESLSAVRPRVLPIGIDMNRFKSESLEKKGKKALREKLNLPKDKKLLIYVGRFVEAKGLKELIRAMDQLDDRFRLVMVGDGPLSEELKAHPKIILAGVMPNEVVKEYLQASDIFVLPSYNEGMPTVIIEAMALRIPVLSSNVGGTPELFGEYKHLLIEPKSDKQIRESVLEYIDGERYPDSTIDAFYQKVTDSYDVATNSRKLVDLYTKLIRK